MDVDMEKPKKQAAKIGQFGDMSRMLDSMQSTIDKRAKHEQRIKQHETARKNEATALDREKQRLTQIANLNVFSDPAALDQLYLHVSSQVRNK